MKHNFFLLPQPLISSICCNEFKFWSITLKSGHEKKIETKIQATDWFWRCLWFSSIEPSKWCIQTEMQKWTFRRRNERSFAVTVCFGWIWTNHYTGSDAKCQTNCLNASVKLSLWFMVLCCIIWNNCSNIYHLLCVAFVNLKRINTNRVHLNRERLTIKITNNIDVQLKLKHFPNFVRHIELIEYKVGERITHIFHNAVLVLR